ncbi:hypothetical protein [Microbulbifer epialgicus]|uniref:Bulb-type lectin domain-containing protein n=1 Tax=Microbulbifer epialgicus TaxID=393907 RepID=A0ABV4NZQ1_9GAMM
MTIFVASIFGCFFLASHNGVKADAKAGQELDLIVANNKEGPYVYKFVVRGANGGSRAWFQGFQGSVGNCHTNTSWNNGVNIGAAASGGGGATITAYYHLGSSENDWPEKMPVNAGLRLIAGKVGKTFDWEDFFVTYNPSPEGAGGGGASALLIRLPNKGEYYPLVVAAGGGGAWGNGMYDDGAGGDNRPGGNGSAKDCAHANGGVGTGNPEVKGKVGGGGGHESGGYCGAAEYGVIGVQCGGRQAQPTNNESTVHNGFEGQSGGSGYGGGGSGVANVGSNGGSGGGGGYCGGDGGKPGNGGGSYLSDLIKPFHVIRKNGTNPTCSGWSDWSSREDGWQGKVTYTTMSLDLALHEINVPLEETECKGSAVAYPNALPVPGKPGETQQKLVASNPDHTGILLENGSAHLKWQGDGNLVLRENGTNKVLWASKTGDFQGEALKFQGDGNFLIKDSVGNTLWSAKTHQNGGAVSLCLHNSVTGTGQADLLKMRNGDGMLLWSSEE